MHLKQLRFGAGHALTATLGEDLVRLERLTSPSLTAIGIFTREGDFDRILFLQSDNVLATLPNKTGVILVRNFENFRSLIGLASTS